MLLGGDAEKLAVLAPDDPAHGPVSPLRLRPSPRELCRPGAAPFAERSCAVVRFAAAPELLAQLVSRQLAWPAEPERTQAARPVLQALPEPLFEALGPPMEAAQAARPLEAEPLERLEPPAR